MKISIIIPTYNEAEGIADLINYLFKNAEPNQLKEIIVVDGQSTDETAALAHETGATVITAEKKGRAAQMNLGAVEASGEILYFLHADTYPPKGFAADIINAVQQGYKAGCCRLQFDYDHFMLRFYCWFTRFNFNGFHYGDQSLFVEKSVFEKAGAFNEDLILMEDHEIIPRIQRFSKFKVLPHAVVTSARKYMANGIYRLEMVFALVYFLYHLRYSQEQLLKVYKGFIKQDKV